MFSALKVHSSSFVPFRCFNTHLIFLQASSSHALICIIRKAMVILISLCALLLRKISCVIVLWYAATCSSCSFFSSFAPPTLNKLSAAGVAEVPSIMFGKNDDFLSVRGLSDLALPFIIVHTHSKVSVFYLGSCLCLGECSSAIAQFLSPQVSFSEIISSYASCGWSLLTTQGSLRLIVNT